MLNYITGFQDIEDASLERKLALPVDDGDVPLFHTDGTTNYRGHVRLDSREKAEAYGYGFLYDNEPTPGERRILEAASRIAKAMVAERLERVAGIIRKGRTEVK